MKPHTKSRHPGPGTRDTLTSKSFESTRRRQPSGSQDHKDTNDFNDSIEKYKKPNLPKKFVDFLHGALAAKPQAKNNSKDTKSNVYSGNILAMQDSVESDSERKSNSSKDEGSPRLNMKSKNLGPVKKESRYLTENTRLDQRSDTMNFVSGRRMTKESDLSMNRFYFQTYDNDSSVNKKGVNTTKLANQTSMKYSEEARRQASSSKRGSVQGPNVKTSNKAVNRSFGNMEMTAKRKSSPLPRGPSLNEKTQKVKRTGPPVKPRREDGVKKTRSFVENGNKNEVVGKERSFWNQLQFESTKDTRDMRDVRTGETVGDIGEMGEKEIFELNANMAAYYDLLIERGQTNSRMLGELKENFGSVMKDFIRNYTLVKHYGGIKQKYDEEREKARKEKEILELQLSNLKKENARLKTKNMGYMKQDEEAEMEKGKGVGSREVQEAITEERKLTELLCQQERVISFLREKENKYISLLDAIGAQGVNIRQIYKDHVKSIKHELEKEDTRIETVPNMGEVKYNKKYGRPPHNGIGKGKKGNPTEGDEQKVHGRRCSSGNQRESVRTGEEYWERQFTEASNSKTFSQHSMHSSKPSFQDEYSNGFVTRSQYDTNNEDIVPIREENQGELKDKLKLDLSTIQQKVIKQYHDEFMEKWPEFTSSWKRAMEKDKTFQHINQEGNNGE